VFHLEPSAWEISSSQGTCPWLSPLWEAGPLALGRRICPLSASPVLSKDPLFGPRLRRPGRFPFSESLQQGFPVNGKFPASRLRHDTLRILAVRQVLRLAGLPVFASAPGVRRHFARTASELDLLELIPAFLFFHWALKRAPARESFAKR
jgi:hypothetical protein